MPAKGSGGSRLIKESSQISTAIMYAIGGINLITGTNCVPDLERTKNVTKIPKADTANPKAIPNE